MVYGIAATGIDPTAALLAEARRRDPAGDYRSGRAEALDLPDRTFDLVVSYLSLIEGMIARLTAEIDGDPVIVSTGGLGARFAEHSPMIAHHDEHLTLYGLKLAWNHLRR